MAFGDLANKLEAAAVALLAANAISGLAGYTGQFKGEYISPAAIFKAEQGTETPQGTGNFNMELTCQVKTSLDDIPIESHRGYFAGVVDLFRDSDFAASLSAQLADFFCLGTSNVRFNEQVQDRECVSELILTCYCCCADL